MFVLLNLNFELLCPTFVHQYQKHTHVICVGVEARVKVLPYLINSVGTPGINVVILVQMVESCSFLLYICYQMLMIKKIMKIYAVSPICKKNYNILGNNLIVLLEMNLRQI